MDWTFEKKYVGVVNYRTIVIYTPTFKCAKESTDDWAHESETTYKAAFNTEVSLISSKYQWQFTLLFLGFGVRILRQWGY